MLEIVDSQDAENTGTNAADFQISPEDKAKVKGFVVHCAKYQAANDRRAVFQIVNTLVPFFIVAGVMIYSFSTAYWLTALLTIPAALLLVRVFIIQHDCGHGSFLSSRKWNNRVGQFMSVLTWTPYDFWRKTHNMHHSGSGNLDNRGFGAIETVTIKEYDAMDEKMRKWYRLYRNPYFLLLVGTPFFIMIGQRIPKADAFQFFEVRKSINFSQIWKSVLGLNLSLIVFFGGLSLIFGFGSVLLAYIPIVIGTSWFGGWLFFVQHQFEDSYWEHQDEWDYHEAAVLGSSYYDLHPILQWLTGSIGLHHIHHLNAKIPNYRLQECMDANDDLKDLNRITLFESFKCAHLALWDESQKKMVRFA
ncbi:MAG: fatty acid desaturase [Zetaproteobacteria bacterium]|nr:MAG: fatty acid desaturase [Zetaproteobacteria bacterium]